MTTKFQAFKRKWGQCQRCELASQRRRICLMRGRVPCDVLFIGEAPGTSENSLGRPFIGPAGKLLDRIITRAWSQAGVEYTYGLTNLVACFPKEAKRAGRNEPSEEAIGACLPRLIEFVSLCNPSLIVCVGKIADKWISPNLDKWADSKKDGRFATIKHPAAILRADITQKALEEKRATVILRDALAEVIPF